MSTTTGEADDNPRPQKRMRISPHPSSPGSLTPAAKPVALRPLPTHILLLTLPSLLLHPPNHRYHTQSLIISIEAVRKCLELGTLDPDIECRAWTALAELGLIAINGGFHMNPEHSWADGIGFEVEKAISKGLFIAQKHPSLRAYKLNLTLLSARLSTVQHPTNPKPTRTLLRRLLSTLHPTDPPYAIYSAHLALLDLHLQGGWQHGKPEVGFALANVEDILSQAQRSQHVDVCVLARVLRLQILVSGGVWGEVGDALRTAELALGLVFDSSDSSSKPISEDATPGRTEVTPTINPPSENAFEGCMAVHTLIIGVIFYTHVGGAMEASARLARLHAMLDEGVLERFPQGIVEIRFPDNLPLILHTTHPRVLYLLAFLVSATAKRDPVGRKPKRWVFATEGVAAWEREVKKGMELPRWAGIGDVEKIEGVLMRLKADMLCELVGVSIMRSEFDQADETVNLLISHTRKYKIFEEFAARITLYHGHLAHAIGEGGRALECYRVAGYVADEDRGCSGGEFVRIAARAGDAALKMGICIGGGMGRGGEELKEEDVRAREMGAEVVKACRGMGESLESVGHVLEACLSGEVLKAKQHLKTSLKMASGAQDNHMRALVLALISAHYVHTAGGHAREILKTCEQLAAGLGASKGEGNVALRLWVGERLVELDKRSGNAGRAERQVTANRRFVEAVKLIARRDKNR